jgi:hypothetical protein
MQAETNNTDEQHLGIMRISMRYLGTILQLPEGYAALTVHIDVQANELRVLVSNPTLPVTAEYQQLPEVRPVYQRVQINSEQSAAMLSEVKVIEHPVQSHKSILSDKEILAQL